VSTGVLHSCVPVASGNCKNASKHQHRFPFRSVPWIWTCDDASFSQMMRIPNISCARLAQMRPLDSLAHHDAREGTGQPSFRGSRYVPVGAMMTAACGCGCDLRDGSTRTGSLVSGRCAGAMIGCLLIRRLRNPQWMTPHIRLEWISTGNNNWRNPSSWMWRRVALVRTDVSEQRIASTGAERASW
jgi:hypothetical protein